MPVINEFKRLGFDKVIIDLGPEGIEFYTFFFQK